MNNEIFDISGNLHFSELEEELNTSFNIVQPYIIDVSQKNYGEKLLGLEIKKDIVGDIRRALMFLVLVREEILFDQKKEKSLGVNYFLDKYETESYRDYLVCRGVDKNIVDALFSNFSLYYSVNGSKTIMENLKGIGDLEIDGDNEETIFKIS